MLLILNKADTCAKIIRTRGMDLRMRFPLCILREAADCRGWKGSWQEGFLGMKKAGSGFRQLPVRMTSIGIIRIFRIALLRRILFQTGLWNAWVINGRHTAT